MKKNLSILGLVFVFALATIVLWALPKQEKADGNQGKIALKTEYSRLTLFAGTNTKGSLLIPTAWEGKYRHTEDGKNAYLIYINNPEDAIVFLTIFKTQREESSPSETENADRKDVDKSGEILSYYLSTDALEKIKTTYGDEEFLFYVTGVVDQLKKN